MPCTGVSFFQALYISKDVTFKVRDLKLNNDTLTFTYCTYKDKLYDKGIVSNFRSNKTEICSTFPAPVFISIDDSYKSSSTQFILSYIIVQCNTCYKALSHDRRLSSGCLVNYVEMLKFWTGLNCANCDFAHMILSCRSGTASIIIMFIM